MLPVKLVNGKPLRCGYTTGSCAAAAAKAAVSMLLSSAPLPRVSIDTPKGLRLTMDVLDVECTGESVSCAVKKDSGDDPDVTDGILVFARVEKIETGVRIDGGAGVGRVTKPGLDQPVGAAAINTVPRRMIAENVRAVCRECGYSGGVLVTISIPGGDVIAARTFNPRLGIEGGISIIGTSGIVEPMSNSALIDSIRLELTVLRASGATEVVLTPGNYGETFCRNILGMRAAKTVLCSNFIGDAIDAAAENGFRQALLVGHVGKLVKLGIGMTNTHSSNGDGRMETLIACALKAGAELPLLKDIADCVTTDAALRLLFQSGLLADTMARLGERIEGCLARRVPAGMEIGYVCFTNAEPIGGVLAKSGNADEMIQNWRTS
jgi:cobalt-precorrin-5B (C1)-methyltransferase